MGIKDILARILLFIDAFFETHRNKYLFFTLLSGTIFLFSFNPWHVFGTMYFSLQKLEIIYITIVFLTGCYPITLMLDILLLLVSYWLFSGKYLDINYG